MQCGFLARRAGALALLPFVILHTLQAGSATWNFDPISDDWNTAANWTPATVPNGESDTATFGVSSTTEVSLSALTTVDGVVFDVNASMFAININTKVLNFVGAGITNNSGVTQQFVLGVDQFSFNGGIQFFNSASAGSGSAFTLQGAISQSGLGGVVLFHDNASAGTGTTYALQSSTGGGPGTGGIIQFYDQTTAGEATFVLEGATSGNVGGRVEFAGTSTAENGAFTCNESNGASTGSFVYFGEKSQVDNATITVYGDTGTGIGTAVYFVSEARAENATLIAYGTQPNFSAGRIFFGNTARGGTARVKVFGTAVLDIASHELPGVTIGSLEGSGVALLGNNNLTVGRNDLSTTFSGEISGGGSLTKIGSGTLTLANANAYTGGTVLRRGKLLLTNNTSSSTTGTGDVIVEGGTLAGNGIIAGAVLVGTGTEQRAMLEPKATNGGVYLTIQKSLTFDSNATCRIDVNSNAGTYGIATTNGVTIADGAIFTIADAGNSAFGGVQLVMINNTSSAPIAGAFVNLPDGGTITVKQNTYRANYEGGDGNDLELTVDP